MKIGREDIGKKVDRDQRGKLSTLYRVERSQSGRQTYVNIGRE